MKRSPFTILVACCATIVVVACERVFTPQHSALADLRRQATSGVGSFNGRVRRLDSVGRCGAATPTVAGVRVEVGLWEGSPAFYRDSLTHQPPSAQDDPRFQLLTNTVTDGEGRFHFDSMPRGRGYAMRVLPPEGAAGRVSYGYSMYGVSAGGNLEDFPTLCVPAPTGR